MFLPEASLLAHSCGLPDSRINRRKRHELPDILVIAICSLLCGAEGFNAMEDFGKAKEPWFRQFLSRNDSVTRSRRRAVGA
ncbi:MAG: transposase family protein [Verrucomicrobiales bacterium]|nr:transposase family protein [Verrucomicrobiales bacterium]MCP5528244.1 transposase family protein [Verrucomicrobiales bacterium]